MNKILKIEETTWENYDGYHVVTEDFTIKMGISNGQNCCENWGYLTSQDNLEEFIGKDFIKYEVVGEKLDTYDVPDIYEGDVMFVNIHTSGGMFQFTAYNSHNGYYGHEAVVYKGDSQEESIYL